MGKKLYTEPAGEAERQQQPRLGANQRLVVIVMGLALCLTIAFAPRLLAQSPSRSDRKILTMVKPAYPQTLKSLHIEGLVRLTAVVQPNGSVTDIDIRGGNPILVENAVKAVKNWKYAPGPSQTREEVVLNFNDR